VSDERITVVLADDQRVVREGLTMVLSLMPDVEILGSAADGEEALALVAQLAPHVVLMDLRMPRVDGVEATRRIAEGQPDTKVVVLTTYADDHTVIQALRAGACGFLTKDASSEQIRDALGAAVRGEAVIDPAVQHHLVNSIARTAPLRWTPPDESSLPDDLTRREAEVLALIAEGLSNAEIAERLVVSETTVKSHINHLYMKTGSRDRAQAVAYAYRNGLAPAASE
jgi:DNA-binding NarL/FixJ family response regulator